MAVTFVRVDDVRIGDNYIQIRDYQGLSTDTKPVDGVGSQSTFYELDTGNWFVYDENNVNSVTSNGWWGFTV